MTGVQTCALPISKNENPNQGAFIIDELTELVEEAVLTEFEKIAERGGVLGAMETGYQRSKIQEESMHYEMQKHTGEYPIVGVNTFRNPHGDPVADTLELARSTDDEKQSQLKRLAEFEKIAERGGVLGAMETGYQRGKIQEESMHYEMLKHTGEYPIIGVNTFRNPHAEAVPQTLELARSTEAEKQSQLTRLADFHARHAHESPAMLARLQAAVIANANVFEVLMDAVRCCSLGQITNALFEVGGQYRRSM